MSDPLWRELHADTDARRPRYDVRYGRCPICLRGFEDAVLHARLWWGTCFHCDTRTPITAVRLETDAPEVDEDGAPAPAALLDQASRVTAFMLADLHQFDPVQSRIFKERSMKTPTTAPTPLLVLADWWADALHQHQESGDGNDFMKPPPTWTRGRTEDRVRWCAALDQAGQPWAHALGLDAWRILRAHALRPVDFAETGANAAALERFYVADPIERQRWAHAVAALEAPPISPNLLVLAARKLAKAGDALAILQSSRDRIEQQIAALVSRRQAADAGVTQ